MGWRTSVGLTAPTEQEIASFPQPNYINPKSREWAVIGVEAPLTFIAAIIVVARFYARTCIKRVLGLDDWLMLAAMVSSTTVTVLHCLATQYAVGLHLWDVHYSWIAPTGKITYATMVLFAPTASLAKISLSMTHLRILPSNSDRIFARGAIIFSVLYCISITTVMIFNCSPISTYWNPRTEHFTCIAERPFNYSAQALNSASDFLIFLWPIRTLWTVRVPTKQRISLIFVFCIGTVVCIAGIFRLYFLYRYFHSYDIYWEGALVFIFGCLETNGGIICGCLPGIKPLLSRMFPRAFGSSSDHYTGGGPDADGYYSNPNYRLRGARLSLRPDPVLPSSPTVCAHRPSSTSMVEVPVKLDHSWSPISLEHPKPVALRVMSNPEIGTLLASQKTLGGTAVTLAPGGDVRAFVEPHPGRRLSEVV